MATFKYLQATNEHFPICQQAYLQMFNIPVTPDSGGLGDGGGWDKLTCTQISDDVMPSEIV